MIFLEVAVGAPVSWTLTYSFDGEQKLTPGQRLLVPLGARQVTGYLLRQTDQIPANIKIRPITDILDQTPIFPKSLIPFYRWIADYYHYPIGEVIKGGLPGGLTSQSGREVILTEAGHKELAEESHETTWLSELLTHKRLSPAMVRKIRKVHDKRLLLKWEKAGFIHIKQLIIASTSKPKLETCVTLINKGPSEAKLKPSEQKTLDLFSDLISTDEQTVPRRELTKIYKGAGRALKGLAEKKIISFTEKEIYRDPFGERPPVFEKPETLTEEQQQALAQLIPAVKEKKFKPFLLHGVTSSGKTEVYLRAAEAALDLSRSVLILVPEIALATQLEGHFFSRFGDEVAVLHSGLSRGQRFDQWQRIIRGQARIVIGARSAVFAPLANPGIIIVDEEHDSAYKQEDFLRYQARDLAILRGSQQGCPVLLGSATPSLASFQNVQQNKYALLSLSQRIMERPLPKVKIVDLRKIPKVGNKPPLFSPELIQALRHNLDAQEQSIIFLNRRGFANLMICQDCGNSVQCRHCHISLTLHKKAGILACHYCGYTTKSAIICSHCGSSRVREVGFGTERVEMELQSRFPKARIARLDRDTTVQRTSYLRILKKVYRNKIDILIGTQMITKGYHFPNMTLVGIIWADAGLGMPDFRAGERTFQLLSQVTGRAGRGEKPGRVIIQTNQPDHYSITTAREHDYNAFFEKELGIRASLQFPPFTRLINLRFSGENEHQVQKAAQQIAKIARTVSKKNSVTLLGPAPAPLSRLRNRYRWQLLLKGTNLSGLHRVAAYLQGNPQGAIRSGKVKLFIDVDPESMM